VKPRRIPSLLAAALVLALAACQATEGPYVPLAKSPEQEPLQHSQRIVILDRNVRNALLFVNAVQKRLPGGQILVKANFQNRLPNDDLWAEVKFEFLDEDNMVVDESEWVNTLFPRAEVTMVAGSSISPKPVKHVMLMRNLRTNTGRVIGPVGTVFEVRQNGR
jgi:hypothetical protein